MAAISMSRRTIALVIAIVLAAVATIALLSYVQGLEDEAYQGAELVQVFKASDVIPSGVSGTSAESQGLIESAEVPAEFRPATAITSLTQITQLVASTDIPAGEILILDRWVAPGQQGSGLSVPPNRVAMSMEVDIPPGVAGFIRQGDRISVIAHLQVAQLRAQVNAQGTQATANLTPSRAQFVVQNIEVLSVGRRVITVTEEGSQGETTETPTDRVLVTVAVRPADAERLVFSVLEGDIYFTLLPEGFEPVDTPGRTGRNVFPR